MKKLLLTTTALAASTIAVSANAAEWEIGVSGYYEQMVSFGSDDIGSDDRDSHLTQDTEIRITPRLVADNGLTFQARVELNADTGDDQQGIGNNAQESWGSVEGSFGRILIGSTDSVHNWVRPEITGLATAALQDFQNQDYQLYTDISESDFIFRPRDFISRNLGDESVAAKINYFTPTFSGFNAAVSYTPDVGDTGSADGLSGESDSGQYENIFDVALRYAGEFGAIRVAAGVNGQFGSAEESTREDLNGYGADGELTFDNGLSFGAIYQNHGEAGELKSADVDDAEVWSLASSYQYGNDVTLGVSYLQSENPDGNEFDDVEIGVKYDLAQGITLGSSYHIFEGDVAGTSVGDNDGDMGLAYLQLNF